MRDLGKMGEDTVSLWCSSVGLVANSSQIDKNGWDFFVEFPQKNNTDLPVDLLPPPIECKIQVKSTDNKSKKNQVTVSNLNKLVKAQLPCFFCFIEFDGKDTAQSAYLVHVGKQIIKKTLKRIRKLDIEGKGNELNKHSVTIKYSKKNQLTELGGGSLKKEILRHISNGQQKYNEQKNNLLHTLGFEEGHGQFTVTIKGEDPINSIVDLTLGIQTKTKVDSFTGHHKRFGILSKAPFIDVKNGLLSISKVKPFSMATVAIKESEFSPAISFEVEFYSTPLNQFVSKKYFKFRLKNNFFEMVFAPFANIGTYNFSIDRWKKYSLRELRDILKCLVLFRNSETLILTISPENHPSISGKFSVNEEIEDWSEVLDLSEKCLLICKEFELKETTKISVNEMLSFSESINTYHMAQTCEPSSVFVEFEADIESDDQEMTVACMFVLSTVVGENSMGRLVAFIGKPSIQENNKIRLIIKEKRVGTKLIATGKTVIEEEQLTEEFNKFSAIFKNEGIHPIRLMD